jgi:hypothetical protein
LQLIDFDRFLATGSTKDSEIGLIAKPGLNSAIFLDSAGDGIVTTDWSNRVLLWKLATNGKDWTSSEIYRSDHQVNYAEPDNLGRWLIVLERHEESEVMGLFYSLSAHEKWFDLGSDYKWLGATFTDKSEVAVSAHDSWKSVFTIPSVNSLKDRAKDSLSPECRPLVPYGYRQSPCWPALDQ